MTIRQLYDRAASTPSDIWEHVPLLYKYATSVRHITEFGTSLGNSTAAFLMGRPENLISYDLIRNSRISEFEEIARAEGIPFRFVTADVRKVEIDPTDLLFIDTWHCYEQTKAELRHSSKVRRYLIFHDTETFGICGEHTNVGIWPAIAELLRSDSSWEIDSVYRNNNGLTVLRRSR